MKRLWIDTETTGPNPKMHAIIQIGGIVDIDGKVVEDFDIRLKPHTGAAIDDKALAVNGISRDSLMSYPDSSEGFRKFTGIMEKYINVFDKRDKFTMYGFNVQFDESFIRELFQINASKYFGAYLWFPSIDVAGRCHEYLCAIGQRPLMPNGKLSTMAGALGVSTPDNLHDALADIRLTRQCWLKVQELEREVSGEGR